MFATPSPGEQQAGARAPPFPVRRAPDRADTERALAAGGDGRIALLPHGANAYGCPPRPDRALIALGSSTASVVSPAGFAAAARLHRRIAAGPGAGHAAAARIREDIRLLSGAAEVPGSEVVLAASGTDVHLFVTCLLRPAAGGLAVVMAEPGETGSSVPAALAGRHFASTTCQGHAVEPLATLDAGHAAAAVAPVALRNADGSPRSVAEVDAGFTDRVRAVLRTGQRCLLVVTDLSKTGLLAPSIDCVEQLQSEAGGQLQVLVDACQFRLSAASVAGYLARGCLVAVTGSKFIAGPAFCGALLLPPALARPARTAPLGALRAYSGRPDWPQDWPAAKELADTVNTGLLLRWEAALLELRAFRALPEAFILDTLETWSSAVAARIQGSPVLRTLPALPLRRAPAVAAQGSWDALPSLHAFTVCTPAAGGARPWTRDQTAALHRGLRQKGVQLGQPVACGSHDGVPVSALRVCASARTLTEAARRADGLQRSLGMAMRAFDALEAQVAQAA